MKTVSIIIPIFNEDPIIDILVAALEERLLSKLTAYNPEVIFVDDGSTDNSFELLSRAVQDDPRFKLVRFSRNFGHQLAITAGMNLASGDAIIVMDADLQDPPEVILEFLEKWEEGYHVVYGVRRRRAGESAFKLVTAKWFYRILSALTNIDIPVDTGDFRLIDRQVRDAYGQIREHNPYVRGLISWLGFRQTGVPYDRAARAAGITKYPLLRMIKFALDAITSFSVIPLRLCTVTGFAMLIVCLAGIVYFLYAKLVAQSIVPGMTATVIILLFFAGVQLTAMGIIGEYIARIFFESKGRPRYIVQDKVNFEAETDTTR
jgi:dolichol-phosphate mannosyltransferase